jgi:hypothetical protein
VSDVAPFPRGGGALGPAAPEGRAALVIAHPGHELLVHGWLELARPTVCVLTDGSGRTTRSRLEGTTKVLDRTGAKPSSIYGGFTDRAGYTAILEHRFGFFVGLAEALAGALMAERIDYVVGDAEEGYNPMHDVCRLVIDAAVRAASRAGGRRVMNFGLPIVGRLEENPETPRTGDVRLELTEEAFTRKLSAVRGYRELKDEVESALQGRLIDTFRVESFHTVDSRRDDLRCEKAPRFYERHGEQRVAAGHYDRVLRYEEHIVPLSAALLRYAS